MPHVTKSKPRKWEEEDIAQLKKLKRSGMSNKLIAKRLDRTAVSIMVKLKRLGKKNNKYNNKHVEDKYRANESYLSMIQPDSVLDLYSGKVSFYEGKIKHLITNDKNKDFVECDHNLPALKLLCKLYYEGTKFDVIDLDAFGSAYECFDLALKLAKKGLIITFGEMGHRRWKRLDYVKTFYNIHTLDDFKLSRLMIQVDKMASRNQKILRPVIVKEWRNIARVYYEIEGLKVNPWNDKNKNQTILF